MPRYSGGDLIEITCNHPTLGNFNFATKSNESYNLDKGGNRSNDDSNMIAGDGTFIDQINKVRWKFEGPIVVDFSTGIQEDALTDLSESAELGTWTFTHISGTIWRGKGKPVGDLSSDTNTAQIAVVIAGSGKIEKL